jgi:peptidoglycan/xylan/chitin deacetylase (PgdA/CDA1 family)
MSTLILVAARGVAGILLFLATYQPWPLVRLVQHLLPRVVFFARSARPVVALTFDDGPDDTVTPQVLDTLRTYRVPATWFLIGERVERHPEIVRRILDEGHGVGNHFWQDRPTWRMSRAEFRAAVERTGRLLPECGRSLLRPASGWFRAWAPSEAARLGYRLVLGSAYASDPMRPPRSYVCWALARMARPGAILVLHVGPGRHLTPDVLPELITRIRTRGLEFVTLDGLLNHEPMRPDGEGTRHETSHP